ncbi:MAG: fructose-bisphosphate aldolase class I [Dehalococcoidia bacterium]|mgnify:FL=1|nr:fructose-bisphosphate aldolase class I [Dehalococcoidia bacterium]MAX04268.1 fructose-bisphosphate aldolase class I [Dehalococcoidia bacterium]|tara:strand:+ start:1580 stop:2605 length:1026 start_codon:yes stop_codon:yes gene_type:complete
MKNETLEQIAASIVAPDKGILAADESSPTIKKRFDSINAESTEENRRDYREMLFKTNNISRYVSGVILFHETLYQNDSEGNPLVKILTDQGIVPGIKVDKGAKPLAGHPNETITEGLDGLRERLGEYSQAGAKFTKWRAVISIANSIPSNYCVEANAHALARFASLSQEAGLVPIIEPEVVMDGTHTIDACYRATESVLTEVYDQLARSKVDLKGTLLKPNMVLSGKSAENRAAAKEVAQATISCFKNTVPSAVPGIVFLSGGQSDNEATVNLDAINRHAKDTGAPWELSFSYGRGLQAAPLNAWRGKKDNMTKAQNVFFQRALVTSAARNGAYSPNMEAV